MAKLTGDLIKVGQRVWAVGYDKNLRIEVPVELVIISDIIRPNSCEVVQVALATPNNGVVYYGSIPGTDMIGFYPGDDGVRPYNYDNRATQVFTTKEDLEQAMIVWDGRNPNWVDENGNDIKRDSLIDDLCDYYED